IDTILSKSGTLLGTIDYISPEQANSIHNVDIRSDLYSLGCTFYHLVAGRVPFPGVTPMEKLVKHFMEEPVALEEVRQDVPPPVASIIRRQMTKEKPRRFQARGELVCAWGAGGAETRSETRAPAAGASAPPQPPAASHEERTEVEARDSAPE